MKLKEFGQTRVPIWRSLDGETPTLIEGNPFAFLIAAALNRGMRAENAWRIPAEIKLKGCLDPAQLASKGVPELIELLEDLAVRPRWIKRGAKTLSDAAKLVWERFGGDAGAIWRGASPDVVEKRLQEIHGIGRGIASMATRILRNDFGCFREQEEPKIDVKPDVHLVRVFWRLGITDDGSPNEAIRKAQCLNPEFPGQLDWPAWQIGKLWCHPHPREPNCAKCPMTEDCAKRKTPPPRVR